MGRAPSVITVVLLLTVVVALPGGLMSSPPLAAAGSPPNSPYRGSGVVLDVDEFARNSSIAYSGGNNTAFSYDGSRFPSGYGGYHLRTSVTSLSKSVDPVPNGDFDRRDEPDNNWTLTQRGLSPYLVQSIDNVTGGNPGYCLQAQLYDKTLNGLKTSQIYNNFTYLSAFTPDSLILSFDIKFSSDIYRATPTLAIDVEIIHGSSQWGWSGTTNTSYSPDWTRQSFSTGSVNGSISLRISIRKTVATPFIPLGSIYFDNFRYAIGSLCPPSEVGLKLNSTAVIDTSGNAGRADIYVDPVAKEQVLLASCWTTSLLFQFNSTYTITFDYNYSMNIKTQNLDAAPTFFTVPADAAPTWVANYTVPGGRPPSNHVGYRFGLYLPSEWVFSAVKNGLGQSITAYSYDASSHFLLLDEGVAGSGQSFSVYASDTNHVLQVHAQRGPTASGPWTNTTTTDYFTTGDYIRVFAELEPIDATGNFANVSVFLPNGTLWRSDPAPSFDANRETLTSTAWQLPVMTEDIAGRDWLVTVCFNTTSQCGMRTQSFAAYIEIKGSGVSPTPGARYLWGSSIVFVNVTWQDNNTLAYVPGATVWLRYVDRYSQVQYVTMSSNGQGAYFTSISTTLLKPNRTAEFDIEFYKVGYINATYLQGTHLPLTFNLVNDVDYEMVRPVQNTAPNEYAGETSATVGFATQARLYDVFEAQYARNDTTPWSGVIRINCSRYEDTGSGWVFAGTGNFMPHSGDATLFEKVDANYSVGLLRVKYTVTARFVGGACDYQQQNFTVIIEMVAFASNLDGLRTVVVHPPSGTGDGWTVFNPALDAYEVHLYAGELLNVTVYYENTSALPHHPISDASVDMLVLGSWVSLGNRGNGYYNYTLDTLSLTVGSTQLEVNASRADCASETIIIDVVIAARPCQLKPTSVIVDVTWGDAFWIVAYYNDTLSNQPITGATVQYQWGPVNGTLTPTGVPGWYNVSLLTVTHMTGQEPLMLTVSHGKYQDCEVILSIRIAPRATHLITDTIQSYYPAANVTHPFAVTDSLFSVPVSDQFIIRLRFTDANGSLVTDATGLFSWIRGTVYLVYADGFYVLQLNVTGVPPTTYVCSIQLSRQNYVSNSTQFQLTVMSLVPTDISGINNNISHFTGQPFGITVFFYDVYHNLGITGATVTLSIPYLGVSEQFTDLENGSYTLSGLTYSVEGVFDIEITAQAGSWYFHSHPASLVLRASTGGNPPLNLIVLVIVVASIALLSGYLAYSRLLRPRVIRPRRAGRMQKFQDVADMFSDVSNLSRFLVLHRGSGIAIFDPFPEQGMDGALFGGFLQAISAFAVDLARASEDKELPLASPLHEISYEGFRILIHDGRLARTALVFKGRPSEKLKEKMEEFTTRFEAKYAKELGEACCTPEAYLDATGLLEEVFQFSLLFPHKVQLKRPDTRRLTDLESKLYDIALAQTLEHDSVLLQEIAKAHSARFKTNKLELLTALYQLRQKKLLVPIEFYRLTRRAHEH